MKTAKAIRLGVETKHYVDYKKLEPFQGEIKTLSKEQYEKMRASILKFGFCFAIHAWKNKGKNYIIDGHQRRFTVQQLEENEGYKIPELPVVFVKAETFEEAKMKVLAGASQYGEMKSDALFTYMQENNITYESLVSNFSFPEINFAKFGESFFEVNGASIDEPPKTEGSDMKTSSDGVRQVQLFFNAETHQEFMDKIKFLSEKYGCENITDTVMECVRGIHSIKIKAK